MAAKQRQFINAHEAASILNCDPKTFRARYAPGITTLNLPGAIPLYSRSEVQEFLNRHITKPTRQLTEVRS